MSKPRKTLDITKEAKNAIEEAIEKALTQNRLYKSSINKPPIPFKNKKPKDDKKTPH